MQKSAAALMLSVSLFALGSLSARSARACGVSASGVASCSLAEHNEAVRSRWAVGVSGLYTSTRLSFGDGLYADQVRFASLAALAYLPTPRLALQIGAGAAFGGSLSVPDGKHELSPGPTALLGAAYRVFDDGRYFIQLTATLSFAAARTQLNDDATVGYRAFDLRLGGEFGVQLANIFRPYAIARAFGGPVFWRYEGRSVRGHDTHLYQLGAGASLRLAKSLNVFVEGVPLGERAVSLGVGVSL